MVEFRGDDAAYLTWLAEHPSGFVLNVRRSPDPEYVVLHRADCASISTSREPGAYTERSYRKICADTLEKRVVLAYADAPSFPTAQKVASAPLFPPGIAPIEPLIPLSYQAIIDLAERVDPVGANTWGTLRAWLDDKIAKASQSAPVSPGGR